MVEIVNLHNAPLVKEEALGLRDLTRPHLRHLQTIFFSLIFLFSGHTYWVNLLVFFWKGIRPCNRPKPKQLQQKINLTHLNHLSMNYPTHSVHTPHCCNSLLCSYVTSLFVPPLPSTLPFLCNCCPVAIVPHLLSSCACYHYPVT